MGHAARMQQDVTKPSKIRVRLSGVERQARYRATHHLGSIDVSKRTLEQIATLRSKTQLGTDKLIQAALAALIREIEMPAAAGDIAASSIPPKVVGKDQRGRYQKRHSSEVALPQVAPPRRNNPALPGTTTSPSSIRSRPEQLKLGFSDDEFTP